MLSTYLVAPTLNYKNTDLAPVMSKETVDYHFNKLAKGYSKRYNAGEGDEKFNHDGHTLHAIYFPQFKKPGGANILYYLHPRYRVKGCGLAQRYKRACVRLPRALTPYVVRPSNGCELAVASSTGARALGCTL